MNRGDLWDGREREDQAIDQALAKSGSILTKLGGPEGIKSRLIDADKISPRDHNRPHGTTCLLCEYGGGYDDPEALC